MNNTRLQDLRDLSAALKIIYKTACEHYQLAESHIFNTKNPEMMKYSLDELRKMKEDALAEWHAARKRARNEYTPVNNVNKLSANIDYNHGDTWYRCVDKEIK